MTRRNRARREERARQERAREQQAAPNALDAVQGKIGRNENAPRTFAPLIVGGVALAAVIGVVAWNAFAPREALTVSALQSPVVGAIGAGEALYPENSREAIGEVVKFGYLPAVDLARLSDGTLVLADSDEAQAELGLAAPVEQTDAETFLAAAIPAPTQDDGEGWSDLGTPVTWLQALEEFGDATVFVPQVASVDLVGETLGQVESAGRMDAVIVRSGDPEVLRIAAEKGATAMYEGDLAGVTPADLEGVGATMVAVPAESPDLDTWIGSDLQVWATGVADEANLGELAERGVYGALAENPYSIQPSAVKQ